MARITPGHRIFGWDNVEKEIGGEIAINIPDNVFGFLDDESERSSSFGSNDDDDNGYAGENPSDEKDNDDRENPSDSENKNFWDTQIQLLQGTLCRTSSLESKIRNITREAVREEEVAAGNLCICGKAVNKRCRSCLMKEICIRLQNSNLNTAICKSKWKTSPNIASGEHTFVDVVENSNRKRGEAVVIRVIIELNFRAEFEMGRGSEEYNELVKKLPEIYVGKTERLLSLIKIMCGAAKKCIKDKNMHLGPWRKQRYMQAKWFNVSERTTAILFHRNIQPPATPSFSTGTSNHQPRPRTRSMLTFDLSETLPTLHRSALAVV